MTNLEKFSDLLDQLEQRVKNTSEKGRVFELLCQAILRTDPFFKSEIKEVWMWDQFPGRGKKTDMGIDLVALDKDNNYRAIQCKFFNPNNKIQKKDVDTFVSESTTFDFVIDNQTHSFSNDRYLFATTNNISKNIDQNKFIFFGPEKISKLDIDWDQFQWKDFFKNQKINFLEKKKLRRDQEDAVKAVIDGFKTSDRGKLVMACGTGKTLTSLKIVEQLYHQHHQPNQAFNVLYLVPSIALLSQTIIEWRIQAEFDDLRTFAICSDVGSADIENIDQLSDQILNSLPIRATTDVAKIANQYHSHFRKVNIFFSTYQSINVIAELAKKHKLVFDIAVCDEAHRTIGGYLKHDEKENVNFMKIHEDRYVPAKKRLYMTATEKIYTERAKKQAKKEGYDVYSMDQDEHYGPLFHRLSFGQAITQELLSDYRVIVFEVTNKQATDGSLEIDLDTNAKVIASLNAISKISSKTYNFSYDPTPMKRVIAFCSRIEDAENIAAAFNQFSKDNYLNDDRIVIPVADVIRGRDPSKIKTEKINWLSKEIESDHCHILTNARCLTEGIDVPLLDGVIFMNDKQSQVDIIQAVGRVMRKGDEKKYGYVIIPVFVNDVQSIEAEIIKKDQYKTVWRVIKALRSHDERLNTKINKADVTGDLPDNICVIKLNQFYSPDGFYDQKGFDTDQPTTNPALKYTLATEVDLKSIAKSFTAATVEKCGDRSYWENWSKNVGEITNNIAIKIKQQLENNQKLNNSFNVFLKKMQELLNPKISQTEVINMLAEHVVTLPVLRAIFHQNKIIDINPVAQLMEAMVQKFNGTEIERKNLAKFYQEVEEKVQNIKASEGRQKLIKTLFENFFQHALPKTAEKFGIVYTPIEIVDFIINSVSEILKREFNQSIAKENIKILDPFTGTGTFIVRLLEKFKELGADNQTLKYKYLNDVWCNEIHLLAYYIALINIEDIYGRLTHEYLSFNHALLTDTFQLSEKRFNKNKNFSLFENDYPFQEVDNKAKEQDQANIRIIIGNPPYSGKQKNRSDNNKRTSYFNFDKIVRSKYVDGSYNSSLVYDSYVRAFRWATDRLGDNGIIGFITNGGFIKNLAFRKFRAALKKEFYQVYIIDLRGNFRKFNSKEGGNVFGQKCGTAVSIVFLVKNNNKISESHINYYQITNSLKTQEKLNQIQKTKSIYNLEFKKIIPDKNNDWLNHKNPEFYKFISIGNKKNNQISLFNKNYSLGIETTKNEWLYSFDKESLNEKMKEYIKEFNRLANELHNDAKFQSINNSDDQEKYVIDYINNNSNLKIKISYSQFLLICNKEFIDDKKTEIRTCYYKPFVKRYLYFNEQIIQNKYRSLNIFPQNDTKNILISTSESSDWSEFSCLATKGLVDRGFISGNQCYPLYWYQNNKEPNLFENNSSNKNYAINSELVNLFRKKYNNPNINEFHIYIYIYIYIYIRPISSSYLQRKISQQFDARITTDSLFEPLWKNCGNRSEIIGSSC